MHDTVFRGFNEKIRSTVKFGFLNLTSDHEHI